MEAPRLATHRRWLGACRPGVGLTRSTKVCAKKRKQKEYGSGRQDLGLPPLEPSGDGNEGVPKLGDYLMFGKLMGEKPAEVQRQLQLNSTAVVVDEESLELLSDWESEDDIEEYAIFEALMEGPGGSTSAASSTLERNKNRVGMMDVKLLSSKPKPPAISTAQRKLAKNKARAAHLTLPSLNQLGSIYSSRTSLAGFEKLAAKPSRPGALLKAKPQRPGIQAARS
ncbi:hypothetical protein N2152v2_008765 [Parachlorella kessleri]